MAEITLQAFVAHHLEHIRSMADQPYEEAATDFLRAAKREAAMTEAEKTEQRLATYVAFARKQEMAQRRAEALRDVRFLPGSTDKRQARALAVHATGNRPFTPRQVDVAATLAWRYRNRLPADLVPAEPIRGTA
ncbi:hypothetical protein ASF60_13575 [Methylobacterium sp. Leaf113]|uniref:hypothetical protein n=1 Tax=Methylobacterium sp. Leaf113 TaxID=1736259 RepID=UPI000701F1FA|nr:hypothetical protein [Methylobacterium sp. Leaf113]KQP94129.1 hypothetical protein ASF60_13575 [Methylobacterium sp. Leaf113]